MESQAKRLARQVVFLAMVVGLVLVAAGCGSGGKESQAAKDFPKKDITIIVPYAAGGGIDVGTRSFVPYLQKYFNVAVVVQNVSGAGGQVGAAQLYKTPADGYTIFSDVLPSLSMGELLYTGQYKALEFTPVFGYSDETPVLLAKKDSPLNSYKDVVEVSKQKKLLIGNPGVSTPIQLQGIILAKETGVNWQDIPFEGTPKSIAGVLGGNLDLVIANTQNFFQYEGLKIIGAVAEERHPLIKDTPTLKEQGYNVSVVHFTRGFFAPPKLPSDIRKKIEDAFAKAMQEPEWQAWAKKAGYVPLAMNADEWGKKISAAHKLVEKYGDDMKKLGKAK